MHKHVLAAFAACAFLAATIAVAAPGELDPTFGSGGIVITPNTGAPSQAVALLPDGRIVVAGGGITGRMARYLPNGAPDLSFGGVGDGTIARGRGDVRQLAVLPDGAILVSSFNIFTGQAELERVLANGSIDLNMGSNGVANAPVPAPFRVSSMFVQPDGRIVLTGYTESQVPTRLAAARMLPNGEPDPTFGIGGVAILGDGVGGGSAMLEDGRLIVAGRSLAGAVVLLRVNTDGTIDTGFPAAPHPAAAEFPRGVLLLPDGRFVVWHVTVGVRGGGLRRFHADGTLDTTFGTAGRQALPLDMEPSAVLRQPDGRLVVTGDHSQQAGTPPDAIVARLLPEGPLDATFAAASPVPGAALQPIGDTMPRAALQPDGRLVAVVQHFPLEFVTVRYDLVTPGDADGDGVPGEVEYAEGLDPSIKDNDVFTDPRLFVMQQYRDFLGREGDEFGIAAHTSLLTALPENRPQLARLFFESPEFQGNIAPVARLYFAFFLRYPDYEGLQFWRGQFGAGVPLAAIAQQFAVSPEFVQRYSGLSDGQFVELVYRNVLGRSPEPAGLAFWTAELDTGARTRGEVMVAFSESLEFRNLIFTQVYVSTIYTSMLRRTPDPDGFAFWLGFMGDPANWGLPIIRAFLASQEYHDRFLP